MAGHFIAPRLIRGPESPSERALVREAAAMQVLVAFDADGHAVRLWARSAERAELANVEQARAWLRLREGADHAR